jgi:hypothetical protein
VVLEEDLSRTRLTQLEKAASGTIGIPEPLRLQIRVQRFDSASGLQRADAAPLLWVPALIPGSSVVEQAAVNRWVDGSNPSRGAKKRQGVRSNSGLAPWLSYSVGVPPGYRRCDHKQPERFLRDTHPNAAPTNLRARRASQSQAQSKTAPAAGASRTIDCPVESRLLW